jgi:hypothetical protein
MLDKSSVQRGPCGEGESGTQSTPRVRGPKSSCCCAMRTQCEVKAPMGGDAITDAVLALDEHKASAAAGHSCLRLGA